jgi:hypothetical protein
VAVFNTAYGDWIDGDSGDFGVFMQRSLAELRQAVGAAGNVRDKP